MHVLFEYLLEKPKVGTKVVLRQIQLSQAVCLCQCDSKVLEAQAVVEQLIEGVIPDLDRVLHAKLIDLARLKECISDIVSYKNNND